jgi:hypothetical protein
LRREEVTHKKYIASRRGRYYFWEDRSSSRGADKKWYPIGGVSTGNRLTAFENFKAITLPQFKSDLHAFILQLKATQGSNVLKAMIKEVKDMGMEDYIDLVLCTDKASATYYSQKKEELTQINAEWDYITDETSGLLVALENLK